jgi:hypothetical protein
VYAAQRDSSGRVDQGDVWNRIERFEQQFGRTTSTAMIDHLRNQSAPRLPLIEGQRGVVIGLGGRVVAAEIFGRSRGLATRWDGIVAAAWLDALRAPSVATPAEEARAFVRRLAPLELSPIGDAGDAGVGRRIGRTAGPLTLRGLASTAGVVHLQALDTSHPYVLAA